MRNSLRLVDAWFCCLSDATPHLAGLKLRKYSIKLWRLFRCRSIYVCKFHNIVGYCNFAGPFQTQKPIPLLYMRTLIPQSIICNLFNTEYDLWAQKRSEDTVRLK